MALDDQAFQADAFQVDVFQVGGVLAPTGTLTLTALAPGTEHRTVVLVPSPISGSAFQIDAFQNNAFQVYPGSSLVLLGQTPTLKQRFLLSAGSLVLTAQTPLIRSAKLVPAGSLVLTTLTPTLTQRNVILVPAAGNLQAFQRDAFQNNAFQIVGNSGLLLYPPPLTVGRVYLVPPSNLTLTTQTPIIGKARLVPAGSLVLTPYFTAVILDQVILVPLAGSESLQFQLPGYGFVESTTGQMQVPGGPFVDFSYQVGLVLNAQTPTILQRFAVPAGALTLNAIAPLVRHRWPVPAGSLLLNTQTPDVVVAANTVPVGQLFLTGQTPSVLVSQDRVFNVPVALLTINGQTVVVTVHFGPPITDLFFDGWIFRDG